MHQGKITYSELLVIYVIYIEEDSIFVSDSEAQKWLSLYQQNCVKILASHATFFDNFHCSAHICQFCIKVAEDDIAFKFAIFNKSLHLNDNADFCSIIQASK